MKIYEHVKPPFFILLNLKSQFSFNKVFKLTEINFKFSLSEGKRTIYSFERIFNEEKMVEGYLEKEQLRKFFHTKLFNQFWIQTEANQPKRRNRGDFNGEKIVLSLKNFRISRSILF